MSQLEKIVFARLTGHEGGCSYIAGSSLDAIEKLRIAIYPDYKTVTLLSKENLPKEYEVSAQRLIDGGRHLSLDGTFVLIKDLDLMEKRRDEILLEDTHERGIRVQGTYLVVAGSSENLSDEELKAISFMLNYRFK